MFYYERLHCYARLKSIAQNLLQTALTWPKGQYYLVDQLKRALCSSLLNLVEGNDRKSSKERKRFFEISKASLSEVAAIVDIAQMLELTSNDQKISVKAELLEITKMIAKLK